MKKKGKKRKEKKKRGNREGKLFGRCLVGRGKGKNVVRFKCFLLEPTKMWGEGVIYLIDKNAPFFFLMLFNVGSLFSFFFASSLFFIFFFLLLLIS